MFMVVCVVPSNSRCHNIDMLLNQNKSSLYKSFLGFDVYIDDFLGFGIDFAKMFSQNLDLGLS